MTLLLSTNFCLSAMAVVPPEDSAPGMGDITNQNLYIFWDDGETKVVGYEEANGDKVFLQYVNGSLEQRNVLYAADNNTIYRTYYGRKETTSAICVEDYITVVHSKPEAQVVAATTTAGTINYRTPGYEEAYIYYGLVCSYQTIDRGNTTYTINGFLGTVVDLVALAVSALNISLGIASGYINNLLVGLAITVVAGVIKEAVTDTVSCTQKDYIWTLRDKNNSSHSKSVTSSRYYITDYKAAVKSQYYYDGYAPVHWREQELAVSFHNEMFTYTVWEVYSWA